MTGETGAGKSILLGALQLALGGRADASSIAATGLKCIVEADFQLTESWRPWFEDQDLDFELETTLRREVRPNGKSRAFINDTPVNLAQLKELSSALIDIHSQQDSALLDQPKYLARLLDRLGQHQDILQAYRQGFRSWKDALAAKEALDATLGGDVDQDYLQFIFEELEAAQIQKDEESQLREELKWLSQSDHIIQLLQALSHQLNAPDSGLDDISSRVAGITSQLGRHASSFESIVQHGEELVASVQSLAIEVDRIQNEIQADPERLVWIESRLATLDDLMRKHRVSTDVELIEVKNRLETQLNQLNQAGQSREAVAQALNDAEQQMITAIDALHQARTQAAPKLCQAIIETLSFMNMEDCRIEVVSKPTDWLSLGGHQYQFMFSANPGMPMATMNKVASGGERSRLMLAIKAMYAKYQGMPTMIMDEIDSGISGQTAAKVADVLRHLDAQLIAITHLPQVASSGEHHWRISKEVTQDQTHTQLTVLSVEERIPELARMLAGEQITDSAIAQAKNLLELTDI